MEDIWNDFKKAVADAEKKGFRPVIQKQETELDMAVNRYRQEKEKQEKIRRFFA